MRLLPNYTNRISLGHNLVNCAPCDIHNVKFTARILSKRGRALQIETATAGREKHRRDILEIGRGRSVVIERENFPREVIAENVFALQGGDLRAAVDVAADGGPSH